LFNFIAGVVKTELTRRGREEEVIALELKYLNRWMTEKCKSSGCKKSKTSD
jgi:hypothetical protein